MCRHAALLLNLLLIQCCQATFAFIQQTPTPPPNRDSVADRVLLKNGATLRGLLVSERPLRLLVRSEWLTEHCPQLLADELLPLLNKTNNESREALRLLLQQELRSQPAAQPANGVAGHDAARRALLQDLLERLAQADPTQLPDWILLEFPRIRVQRLEQVTDQRRQLCRLGMLNQIPQLEQLPSKAVQRQLEAIPAAQRINVFQGQPPGQTQNVSLLFEKILAAVDIRSGSASRVIQSGPVCVDEAAPGSIPLLFQQAFQQNFQTTLNELLAEASGTAPAPPAPAPLAADEVPPEATAVALRQGSRTLVISSSITDLSTGSAVVSRRVFLQRDGEWRQQFALQEQATLKDVPADRAQQLAEDPQIKELTQIAETFGLSGDQLQTALGMGSVVQTALARLQAGFDEQLQALLTARWTDKSAIPLLRFEESVTAKPAPEK